MYMGKINRKKKIHTLSNKNYSNVRKTYDTPNQSSRWSS
jgi:hypothetical protein